MILSCQFLPFRFGEKALGIERSVRHGKDLSYQERVKRR